MKKNSSLFLSVAAFVLLFYRQNVALNLSLFSILVWLLLFFQLDARHKGNKFWIFSAGLFISIISFAWYGDFASFAPLFLSMLLVGFAGYFPKLNVITSPVLVAINYITSPIRMLFINRWMKSEKFKQNIVQKIIFYFLIPAVFVIVFIVVYAAASKKFASYFTFDWDIDFLQIIVLVFLGFFFMFNFFHFFIPKYAIKINPSLKDDFSRNNLLQWQHPSYSDKTIFLRRSGEITMVLLNLLLVFFIITYFSEHIANISTAAHSASGPQLSSQVHERVYVLIFSIVMAIMVLMIYFKGEFNFDKNAKWLKMLSYVWLALNTVLIFTVALKNAEYVQLLGLTFKRISVFIFLLLCLSGLLFTYIKVINKKTNIFLVNRMFWICYATIVVTACINWSWIVTKYNIANRQSVDWDYLYSLQYNKQLLYDIDKFQYKKDCTSCVYDHIKNEQNKSFLSKNLYYQFLDFK